MKFSEFNIATSAGQIDYIVGYSGIQNYRISPSQFIGTYSTLNYIADSGNGTIDLGTQAFSILGTANEIETVGVAQTLTLRFPAAGVILPDGSRATTQPLGDNSTKVATTAYVNASITAEDLDFSGDTGTGSVDLDSQILNIIGTTNEIETAASGQTLTIGLPDDVSITGELTVLGIGQSSFAGQVTIPLNPVATTDAASKGYVDSQITAQDLDFTTDSGSGQVDLDSQVFNVLGTANEIETSGSGQTVTIGLPDDVTVTGELTVSGTGQSSFGGQVTIPATPVAGTDAASKDYVDSQVTAQDLDFQGDSGSGAVDLDSQIFTLSGTTNEIETSASGQTITIGLPNDVTIGNDLTVTSELTVSGAGQSSFSGQVTIPLNPTANTDAASKGYVDSQITAQDLDFQGDSGTGQVDLDSQIFTIAGTANEIETSASLQTITIGLPNDVTISGTYTGATFAGQLDGSISSATIATTQAPNDNSTKVATTAYVDTSAGNYLPLAGGTMSGNIAMGGNDISGGGTATFTTFVGALTGNASTASALAASGNITLTGDTTSTGGPYTYTSGGNVAIATTIADTTVTGKVLTGVNLGTAQVISATDSILDAFGYLQAQITQLPQGLVYQGTWNASTNTPTLTSGTGTTGHFYIVSVAGSTNLDGITDWQVGDWAIFVESGGTDTWQKIDNTSAITGTGATNKLAKWTGPTTLSTGLVEDDGTTVTIGNSGDLDVTGSADITGDLAWSTSLTDTTNLISITKFVDEADGITANDNDTSIPTSAAVKDYVDTQIGTVDTLAEVLAIGNTTGGTDIAVSAGDDITFTSTSKAIFNSSLEIYHDGSNSYIREGGIGDLLLRGNNLKLQTYGGADYLTASNGAQVELYYNNFKKLETTNTGISVTGNADISGEITVGTNDTVLQNDKLIFKSTSGAAIGHNTAATAIQFYTTTTTALDTLALTISGNNLTVSGELGVSGTGQSSFAGQVTIPLNPVANTDAASKGYVDSQIGLNDTLAEILANGNTTGGTDIAVSAGDNITFTNTSVAYFGSGNDLAIEHSGTLGQITNSTGDLYIQNGANNSDIIFRSDDGSGGLSNYIYLNGSAGTVSLYYYGSQKLYTATNGIQVTGNADISGQVQVGGANSLFAENNLRFNSAGAAYIDHNTVGQAINFRLSNASALDTTVMVLNSNGSTRLNQYGSGTFTGTAAYNLQVDSSGNIIETPGSVIDGSGTTNYVAKWQDPNTLTNSVIYDNGTNVGVGTASPTTAKLVVDADQNIYGLRIDGDTTTGQSYGVRVRAGTNSVDAALRVENTSASTLFTILGDGNVGIGTSTPTATLELNSTTGNAAKLRVGRQTTATNYLELGTDGGSSVINAIGIPGVNAGLIFKRSTTTTTTESMHIDGNGRIYNYESLANGNTFYGWSAGNVSTTGQFNTSIGYNSGDNITGGSHNTLYGRDTGQAITTGYDNTAIGGQAGKEIVGGHSNTLIGRTSGQAITSGTENTFVGKGSGNVQTTASYNIFIGNNAGQFNTTGSYTVAIGREALRSQTTGGYSTAVGYQALYSTTTSNLNTGVGMQAGFYQTGTQNTFVGAYSGIGASGVSTGNNNTSLGYRALTSLRAGQQNTVLGTAAGYNLTDGSYNTLVGLDSGFNTTTGVSNAAFGRNTLVANTTGSYNTALGSDSLYNSTTASNNTALGYVALYNNTTGTENTALGRSALESSTTGSYNTAVGYQSLYLLGAGGDGNTAMGQQALQNNTASHNTAFGRHALIANTSGSANVAVGAFAGDSNTTGVYNTYIGYDAGQAANNNENVHIGFYAGRLSTGGENTIIGSQAVRLNNSSATNIVAIGRGAMYKLSSGNDNTAIGHQAGFEITTAINNTLVGKNSGDAITTGSSNTAVGQVAYSSNTTGTGNTAIGRASMQSGASGNYNTGVGNDTLEVATGSYNTAVGYRAGLAIQGANNNIAIGALSMFNGSVTGTQNVVVGTSGMYNLTTGNYNTGVGEGVMSVLTTGSYNTAMGREALDAQSTANSTTAIGYQSLTSANADGNTALGFQSGYGVTSGTYNVLIGHETGSLITTGSNNIAIGDRAGRLVGAASNNVHIGHQAGYESNEPVGQIAIGYRAGYDNAGDYSVYVGYEAGYNTGSGNDSVGVGYRALHTATSGVSNTAVGYGAGLNITTGNNNTALGTLALSNVTTGSLNLGIGRDAFGEVTVTSYNTGVGNSVGVYQTGNYNTSMGYHSNYGVSAASSGDYNATFGYYAGAYNRGENNTFLGALAGRFNSTGQRNTIVGSQAADNATITGSHNTALGFGAAHNITSGVHNVLIGDSSFFSGNANYTIAIGSDTLNTATGSDNVAIGYRAGYNVTSGSDNTLIGYQTGYSLTTGAPNTAVGRWALYSATTGFANTLMGYDCGASLTSGFQNVAMGQYAMRYSTTAGVNVAIGYEAMGIFTSTTSGARNVAVGYQAGAWITTGANNVLLGGNAGGSTSPAGQITTASNRVCLGDNNITHLYCATSTITTSDARDKTDVEDLTLGLDFIKELNPKTYRWDKRDWYEDGTPDGSKKAPKIESGLMAQEVLEAEKKFGYATEDNDMLFVDETEDKTKYGMKYERLVPVLINAIKELEKEIVNLKSQINK